LSLACASAEDFRYGTVANGWMREYRARLVMSATVRVDTERRPPRPRAVGHLGVKVANARNPAKLFSFVAQSLAKLSWNRAEAAAEALPGFGGGRSVHASVCASWLKTLANSDWSELSAKHEGPPRSALPARLAEALSDVTKSIWATFAYTHFPWHIAEYSSSMSAHLFCVVAVKQVQI
jgi:hypothetical protein